MHSRKNLGRKMKPSGIPSLTEYPEPLEVAYYWERTIQDQKVCNCAYQKGTWEFCFDYFSRVKKDGNHSTILNLTKLVYQI